MLLHIVVSAMSMDTFSLEGDWTSNPALRPGRREHAVVVAGDHVYSLGGRSEDTASLTQVNHSQVQANGNLGVWQVTESWRWVYAA